MMEKRTLWQWLFGLMAKPAPEPRQPMAVPNTPARGKWGGTMSFTEDEWNEQCSLHPTYYDGMRAMSRDELIAVHQRMAAGAPQRDQGQWRPGIEHGQPHPVKENADGTLYYKGKVYRMIGQRGRRNKNDKRRQG